MKTTTNYALKKPDGTDSYNIQNQNDNMDTIDTELSKRQLNTDYVRVPGYAAATGTANNYAITLNPAPTAYVEGMAVSVKINGDNTGAATLNINGLGAQSIVDSKGNPLIPGKLKGNSICSLRYNGTNFILQGEGGDYGTATAADVLSPKTIGTDSGIVTGSIPSKSAQTYTPGTTNQTIAAGQYLSGAQTISGDVDLVAGNIKYNVNIFGVTGNYDYEATNPIAAASVLSGKVGFVNGAKITGSIASKAAATITPGTTAQTIASGQYLSGTQTISGDANLVTANIKSGVSIFGVSGKSSVVETSAGTAAATDILSGKVAYVNGAAVTGNIASKAAATITPGTAAQTIAAGQYLSGIQTIAGDANLIASNIKSGVSIFGVPGNVTQGFFASGTVTSDGSFMATVSGLTFTPDVVCIYRYSGGEMTIYVADASTTGYTAFNGTGSNQWGISYNSGYVNATGFKLKCVYTGTVYSWVAYTV